MDCYVGMYDRNHIMNEHRDDATVEYYGGYHGFSIYRTILGRTGKEA